MVTVDYLTLDSKLELIMSRTKIFPAIAGNVSFGNQAKVSFFGAER